MPVGYVVYSEYLKSCANFRRIHTLIGHRAEVSSAQFNYDCSVIASGSMDKTCKLWDVASGTAQPSKLISVRNKANISMPKQTNIFLAIHYAYSFAYRACCEPDNYGTTL